MDTEGITSILNAVKAEKPDFTVALLHWGSENNDTISSTQESIVKLLQKNGVDKDSLQGIGICMPSFILFDEGYVCMTSAMVNIRDFPMRDYLQERLRELQQERLQQERLQQVLRQPLEPHPHQVQAECCGLQPKRECR